MLKRWLLKKCFFHCLTKYICSSTVNDFGSLQHWEISDPIFSSSIARQLHENYILTILLQIISSNSEPDISRSNNMLSVIFSFFFNYYISVYQYFDPKYHTIYKNKKNGWRIIHIFHPNLPFLKNKLNALDNTTLW